MNRKRQVVVSIGAHPDDVELGMGGTLAKHSHMGDDVHIILCTLGIGGSSGDQKARQVEAQTAANILQAKLHVLDYPVIKLNQPSTEFTNLLRKIIEGIGPDRIYTHSPFDYHQVHEAVSECSSIAAKDVPQMLFYEVISSTNPEFRANAYVDITDYLETKVRCLELHNTQSGKSYMQADIIRSLARTRYLMGKIGSKSNGMAEAFAISRLAIASDRSIGDVDISKFS